MLEGGGGKVIGLPALDLANEPVLKSCDFSGNLLSANLFVDNRHEATLF